MEKISNRALISRLFRVSEEQLEDADYDKTDWSQWYSAVQQLTGPEKMVYVIVKLNQTVTFGGFANFYETSCGVFTPEIIHALEAIKALQTADIVAQTLSIVNPNGLLDEEYKAFVFNIQLSAADRAHLFAQDIRYDQLQDRENLEDLLGNFLQENV